MNIAIDIDDTLTESFDYFLPYVAEYFDVDEETLRKQNISYSNLPKSGKRMKLDFAERIMTELCRVHHLNKMRHGGWKRLRELGHRIVIITARTDALYTDPYQTTEQELANGGICYDKLICTFDKAKACVEEEISVLIDDSLTYCDAASEKGISTLLFSSKANQYEETEHIRVSNWEEVI